MAGAGHRPARWLAAAVYDRWLIYQGRPQKYGTQFDWDDSGQLNPHPVEDPGRVDERRRSVGLGPLAEHTRRLREEAARSGEGPPADRALHRRKFLDWCREVGWRE